MFRIALDAGHGLKTAGKHFMKKLDPDQTREWVRNDLICRLIEKKLKPYNCEVLRVDDTTGAIDISRKDRAKRANAFGADIYLSIHHNAGIYGGKGGGIVAFVWKKANAELLSWQRMFYDALIEKTGLKGNRATPLAKKNFDVLVYTNMQAILIENGFMDSATDVPIILTDDFAEKASDAYVETLVKIGKLTKTVQEPPKEPTKETETPITVNENDVVSIASNASYYNGKSIPAWVKKKQWIVADVNGDRAVLGKSTDGQSNIQSAINTMHLIVVKSDQNEPERTDTFTPYRVRVKIDNLSIWEGAGTNTKRIRILPRGVYTIVEERTGKGASMWGKLKSGAGWISLDNVEKV